MSKIEILKERGLIIETTKEYKLTQLGWYNYVNLLYYLSPKEEQRALIDTVQKSNLNNEYKNDLTFNCMKNLQGN